MDDFKVVPVKPTEEMTIAASKVGYPLTYQNVLRIWKAMLAAAPIKSLKSQPAQPSDSQGLDDNMRSFIEGMSVSIDVSTGSQDAGHRLFGTVSEVMDSGSDKHGVILLVQDQKPNFKPSDNTDSANLAEVSDTEMLDWLLSDGDTICKLPNGSFEYSNYELGSHIGATPREAIKAAMRAQEN